MQIDRITHDPAVMGGKPCIRGMRVTSVLQVRRQNVLPEHMAPFVVAALRNHATALTDGALVVVEERKCRVRVLPI